MIGLIMMDGGLYRTNASRACSIAVRSNNIMLLGASRAIDSAQFCREQDVVTSSNRRGGSLVRHLLSNFFYRASEPLLVPLLLDSPLIVLLQVLRRVVGIHQSFTIGQLYLSVQRVSTPIPSTDGPLISCLPSPPYQTPLYDENDMIVFRSLHCPLSQSPDLEPLIINFGVDDMGQEYSTGLTFSRPRLHPRKFVFILNNSWSQLRLASGCL